MIKLGGYIIDITEDLYGFAIFIIMIFLISSITIIPTECSTKFSKLSSLESCVKIVGLSATDNSSPVQVRRGSVISVKANIKNTGEQARTFYAGASIIGEGESTWKDLSGWGTTPILNPDEIYTFKFSDYTIPLNAYYGYHGILVKVWADSSKTTQLTERWFQQSVLVDGHTKGKVVLSFDFESDDELKSSGYISHETLNTMTDTLNLLYENEISATIFVQGACLNNSRTGNDFKIIINQAIAMGFEIASHTYSHPDINDLGEQDIEKEIVTTERLLEELIGMKPLGFRAPYFRYNERLWEVLAKRGYFYDSAVWYNDEYHPQSDSSPYPLLNSLFEVPLMEADITKENNWEKPLSYWINIIDKAASGNMVVLDFHPQNIKNNWEKFLQIVDYIISL